MRLDRRSLLQGASATALLAAFRPADAARRDTRIERLIATMSIEEKAGQLSLFSDPVRGPDKTINPGETPQGLAELKRRIATGALTGLYNGAGAAVGRELQRVAVEQSRHGIPLIFAADVIHGMRTQFPIPLAEAASFDPDLAERTARAAALEASALGIHWTFAPMVDVARDQRWGRVAEGSGEDPWLGARIAEARVRGFQGRDLTDDRAVLACPKHFAAYGAVEGGKDYNTADIPETTLREVHLPPFQAAFAAGALTTMSSFNDIGGVPATGNRHLLTDILRGEWGFTGLVVSDYTADEELILHGYAADGADAVAKAITAGCDVSMESDLYNRHLPALVRSGRVPMRVVDEAVRRVLRVKQAIGLFDDPYRSLDPARETTDIRTEATVALARESARKSVVLLKNEGDLLPLAKTAAIALIGPAVSDRADLPGPWAVFPDVAAHVTIEEGFRAAMGPRGRLAVERGCDYETALAGGVERAVAAASSVDVVVLVVGEHAGMSGEAQSRVEITVPAPQQALAEAIAATGKPVVVLLRHGRALALAGAVRDARAIMATWFLGSETGHALADLVFGDASPQARLPVSFPQASGQEPFFYNHRRTGRPQLGDDAAFKARYREVTDAPLYAFGHGLTYSTCRYGPTQVGAPRLVRGGTVTVAAVVTNTGRRSMHEVAQLYVHPRVATITQPVRALRGVRHLDLAPGESRTASFTLAADQLGYVHADLRRFADPGAFDLWVAPSATTGTPAVVTLV